MRFDIRLVYLFRLKGAAKLKGNRVEGNVYEIEVGYKGVCALGPTKDYYKIRPKV